MLTVSKWGEVECVQHWEDFSLHQVLPKFAILYLLSFSVSHQIFIVKTVLVQGIWL